MKIWSDFKAFAVKGNAVDMAVGIMIGAAFSTVVKSLVDDVLMPPIGLLTGGIDLSDRFLVLGAGTPPGPYESVAAATQAGAVLLRYGNLANAVLSFLIVAGVLFGVVRWMNSLQSPDTPAAPGKKPCPHCMSVVHIKSTRCPHCTSTLTLDAPAPS